MKKFLITILLGIIPFAGCAKKGDSPASVTAKTLWSTWTSNDSTVVLNLNNGQFGSAQTFTVVVLPAGFICSCGFLATGTNSGGNYAFSSCVYSSGGNGNPGTCGNLNQSGTFTNDGATMTACASGSCTSYH